MKKIKNAVFTENKKLIITIISVAVFMLLISIVNVEFDFSGYFSIGFSSLASFLSVIPLTIGISAVMLMKTKKNNFGELPSYIIAIIICMIFLLLYFFNFLSSLGVLAFAICVLLAYPYLVAGFTVRGCIYTRNFALAFAGILLALSIGALVVAMIFVANLGATFSLTYLVLPLMYVELILNILCFRLEPLKKKKTETESII